ncbi:MAG: hypothetical protein M3417_13365 [Actinomycetota bacterium]|nr:hypothetical protein [Actinomycetota bacterium]
MRTRRLLGLLSVLVVLPLTGCGFGLGKSDVDCGGKGGRVCTVRFEVPGEKDLSSAYGPRSTVAVKTIAADAVTVRIKGEDAKLVANAMPTTVGGLLVALARVSDEGVLLLISPRPAEVARRTL